MDDTSTSRDEAEVTSVGAEVRSVKVSIERIERAGSRSTRSFSCTLASFRIEVMLAWKSHVCALADGVENVMIVMSKRTLNQWHADRRGEPRMSCTWRSQSS